jgi:hypothetical protein
MAMILIYASHDCINKPLGNNNIDLLILTISARKEKRR